MQNCLQKHKMDLPKKRQRGNIQKIVIQPKERGMKEEYSENYRRWYDKDPILSKSMSTLEKSDDETQIKVALNLIKIIIEHNISEHTFTSVEDMMTSVEEGLVEKGKSRWYDLDTTVRTAINMLENSPVPVQKAVAKEMAKMVVDKIKEDKDEQDDDEEV